MHKKKKDRREIIKRSQDNEFSFSMDWLINLGYLRFDENKISRNN
jgi:hypothetical protein